ncbi:unnamed protein product [Microthlaspi erraticum]|uniref:Uncharacterized protein n=1 Tax=Microthlaspi erraticum TaxID=1685480 RepID=A0A6D2J134_9BRAS|nr:unnamed protein product [Microthlaspi erraticum]
MPPKKGRNKKTLKHKRTEAEDEEHEREVVSGDDCEVVGDEDCDEVGNEAADEEEDGNNLGVQEEGCQDLCVHFGEAARDEEVGSDADSGDDIWNDDRIPDPLSSEDEDDEEESARRETEDPDELLA